MAVKPPSNGFRLFAAVMCSISTGLAVGVATNNFWVGILTVVSVYHGLAAVTPN